MILAVALGNPIRGDDGAGPALARRLAARVPGLEVVESMEALPELAEDLARARRVVFLDATVDGRPGEVRVTPLGGRPPRDALLHALTPADVLGLAEALWGDAPAAALVTITGRDFSYAERLSPPVEAALEEAAARAEAFITQR